MIRRCCFLVKRSAVSVGAPHDSSNPHPPSSIIRRTRVSLGLPPLCRRCCWHEPSTPWPTEKPSHVNAGFRSSFSTSITVASLTPPPQPLRPLYPTLTRKQEARGFFSEANVPSCVMSRRSAIKELAWFQFRGEICGYCYCYWCYGSVLLVEPRPFWGEMNGAAANRFWRSSVYLCLF